MQGMAEEFFIKRGFTFYDSGVLAVIHPTIFNLFENIRRYVWRSDKAGHPTIRQMLREGWLVTRVSQDKLGEHLGVRREHVNRLIEELRSLGWLETHRLPQHGGVGALMYVLGTVSREDGEQEKFFADVWMQKLWRYLENVAQRLYGPPEHPDTVTDGYQAMAFRHKQVSSLSAEQRQAAIKEFIAQNRVARGKSRSSISNKVLQIEKCISGDCELPEVAMAMDSRSRPAPRQLTKEVLAEAAEAVGEEPERPAQELVEELMIEVCETLQTVGTSPTSAHQNTPPSDPNLGVSQLVEIAQVSEQVCTPAHSTVRSETLALCDASDPRSRELRTREDRTREMRCASGLGSPSKSPSPGQREEKKSCAKRKEELFQAATKPVAVENLQGLSAVVATAKEKSDADRKARAERKLAEGRKAEARKGNLNGKTYPPSRKAQLTSLEGAMLAGLRKLFPGTEFARWEAKERGQADHLLKMYSFDTVMAAIVYLTEMWSTIQPRFKVQTPTLGWLLSLHGALVPESQRFAKVAAVLKTYKQWAKDHPTSFPPSDLCRQYDQIKPELKALGLEE